MPELLETQDDDEPYQAIRNSELSATTDSGAVSNGAQQVATHADMASVDNDLINTSRG